MSNEAAERLVREWGPGDLIRDKNMLQDVEWTLASERKATVERVRAIVALLRAEVLADTDSSRWRQGGFWVLDQLTGHLDAEAAR